MYLFNYIRPKLKIRSLNKPKNYQLFDHANMLYNNNYNLMFTSLFQAFRRKDLTPFLCELLCFLHDQDKQLYRYLE